MNSGDTSSQRLVDFHRTTLPLVLRYKGLSYLSRLPILSMIYIYNCNIYYTLYKCAMFELCSFVVSATPEP